MSKFQYNVHIRYRYTFCKLNRNFDWLIVSSQNIEGALRAILDHAMNNTDLECRVEIVDMQYNALPEITDACNMLIKIVEQKITEHFRECFKNGKLNNNPIGLLP